MRLSLGCCGLTPIAFVERYLGHTLRQNCSALPAGRIASIMAHGFRLPWPALRQANFPNILILYSAASADLETHQAPYMQVMKLIHAWGAA